MGAATPDIAERLARLEKQVAEIRRRLDGIERTLAIRSDNPSDRTAIREKVTFDWQS